MITKLSPLLLFVCLLVGFLHLASCTKGLLEHTTLIISPIRHITNRPVPYAKILLYTHKDSFLNFARTDMLNTNSYGNKIYLETDSNGVATLVDSTNSILSPKVYYFYIYDDATGQVFENFSDKFSPLSDSNQFSTLGPITRNVITSLRPYVYLAQR